MPLPAPPRPRPTRDQARKDFGDFQTPPALVLAVRACLEADGDRFDRVLEPTCGVGHFLAGFADCRDLLGVEIQPSHADQARRVVGDRGAILTADLFPLDLARDLPWRGGGRLLVVGNPPWVTVAGLGASSEPGRNPGPTRINARKVRGLDSMTGGSNFDLAEAVALKLIRELAPERPTIAPPL